MKDLETIKKIISEDESRPYFKQPFSDGINTYVANSFCVLRIKGQHSDLIPEQYEKSLSLAIKIFDTFKFSKERCTLVLKSAEVKEVDEKLREKCPQCDGKGEVYEQICYECDGAGEVEFENDYHHYECTCETCNGKYTVKSENPLTCERCGGSGKEKIKGNLRISENSFLNLYLLNYVLDFLVEIKVAVDSENLRYGVPFINGNIEGIIMPVIHNNAPVPVNSFDYRTKKIIEPW